MGNMSFYSRLQLFDGPIEQGRYKGGSIRVCEEGGPTVQARVLDVTIAPITNPDRPDYRDLIFRLEPGSVRGGAIPSFLRREDSEDVLAHPFDSMSEPDEFIFANHRKLFYVIGQVGTSDILIEYCLPQSPENKPD